MHKHFINAACGVNSMLNITQRELVLKDFAHFKLPVLGCAFFAVVSVALFCIPSFSFLLLGMILFISIMIGFYCYLAMTAIVKERKDKHLLFVMSLPITVLQYHMTKLVSCFSLYLALWLVTYTAIVVANLTFNHLPGFMLAYLTIVFACFLPAFISVVVIAIGTESEAWTIVGFVTLNIFLSIGMNVVPQIPAVQAAFTQGSIAEVGFLWPSFVNTVLLSELLITVIAIAALWAIVQRKSTFVTH